MSQGELIPRPAPARADHAWTLTVNLYAMSQRPTWENTGGLLAHMVEWGTVLAGTAPDGAVGVAWTVGAVAVRAVAADWHDAVRLCVRRALEAAGQPVWTPPGSSARR